MRFSGVSSVIPLGSHATAAPGAGAAAEPPRCSCEVGARARRAGALPEGLGCDAPPEAGRAAPAPAPARARCAPPCGAAAPPESAAAAAAASDDGGFCGPARFPGEPADFPLLGAHGSLGARMASSLRSCALSCVGNSPRSPSRRARAEARAVPACASPSADALEPSAAGPRPLADASARELRVSAVRQPASMAEATCSARRAWERFFCFSYASHRRLLGKLGQGKS